MPKIAFSTRDGRAVSFQDSGKRTRNSNRSRSAWHAFVAERLRGVRDPIAEMPNVAREWKKKNAKQGKSGKR